MSQSKAPYTNRAGALGSLTSRRAALMGAVGLGAAAMMPGRVSWASADGDTRIDDPADILFAFVERATGRVQFVRPFSDMVPLTGLSVAPYRPPRRNIYLPTTPTLFRLNAERYGIVDMATRNSQESYFFSSLRDSYRPAEFTHHLLLTMADMALLNPLISAWVQETATEDQRATALDLLHRLHGGYNGRQIIGDPERLAEAERYYTARELLRPVLYLKQAPRPGELAQAGSGPVQFASTELVQAAHPPNPFIGGVTLSNGTAGAIAVAVVYFGSSAQVDALAFSWAIGIQGSSERDSGDGGAEGTGPAPSAPSAPAGNSGGSSSGNLGPGGGFAPAIP